MVSEVYKGIRLRPVTNERVSDLIEARIALEASARHVVAKLAAIAAPISMSCVLPSPKWS